MLDIRTKLNTSRENQLYQLLSEQPEPNCVYREEEHRIRSLLGRLRETLNLDQKELLFDIINEKDVIAAKTAEDAYENGFRRAVKMMVECFYRAPNEE